MNQLEWKCCDKCGELVSGIYCWNCDTLNIDHLVRRIKKIELTDEYKEVVKQELKKIGYNCSFSDDGETIYVDNNPLGDWLDVLDMIQIEFMNEIDDEEDNIIVLIFDIEEIDNIHKLSRMIDYIENGHYKGRL